MTDSARLAAYARQLAVGMVGKVRQDQKERSGIRPGISPGYKGGCGNKADQQAHRRQVVGRDPAVLEWRDKTTRQPRIPWACSDQRGVLRFKHYDWWPQSNWRSRRARESTYFTRDFLVPSRCTSTNEHQRIYNPLSTAAKALFCRCGTGG